MSIAKMTSRERMLAAIERRGPDYVPCSFMIFQALKSRSRDYKDYILKQLEMGLDTFVQIPPRPPAVVNDYYNLHGLPVSYDPRVKITEWVERIEGEVWPIMVKEYRTPAGTLRAEVRQTDDWRWGDHVPFLDDYVIPRSRKYLVTQPSDLEALRYLFVPSTPQEVAAFEAESEPYLSLANNHSLLVAGGWGVGADLIGWVCGLENMVFLSYDSPAFFRDLLEIIAAWNRSRMEVVLGAGIDLYIKRAWYENLDFFTPNSWYQYLRPILKAEADLAHERGAKFGYIITSNCMSLLEKYVEVGVDVLIGVDPYRWNIEETKQRVGDRICLWGGVNGYLTVEMGSEEEVRAEVRRAMQVLAPGSGFILSPVDNIREGTELALNNVKVLIDEWQRFTS
jgi:uroporphyrinogen-III decarboxylase